MIKCPDIATKWYSINHDIFFNCLIIMGILFYSLTSRCSRATLVVLISLYTVFVGLVLFLIVKLSDPFQGDIGVTPAAFEYLVETLQSEIR